MAYTNIDDPSAYFQATTYAGAGGSQTVTNDGNSDLQPDLVYVKNRSSSSEPTFIDTTRGGNKFLYTGSFGTSAEESASSNGIASFNTDGITWDTVASTYFNSSGNNFVAWQWKANAGTTSSNTDGTVTSTVQVNQDAGFSIVTWTTGLGGGNHSVGHGLGVKPAMFITKSRGSTSFWTLWHQGMAGDTSYIRLDATTAEQTFSDIWGDGITSSVFGYNYPATVYANQPYIAYCFAEKQGYSKFGSYVGNGNADGAFVYTGFKPAFVMTKSTSTSSWSMYDHKRLGYNPIDVWLRANGSDAESTSAIAGDDIDLYSNGFKLRNPNGTLNASGTTYIYMAFAENPFVTSTGIPTTAR